MTETKEISTKTPENLLEFVLFPPYGSIFDNRPSGDNRIHYYETWEDMVHEKEVDGDELARKYGFPTKEALEQTRAKVLKGWYTAMIPATYNGINSYGASLGYPNRETFLNDLQGKTIIDLGSALGALAREAHLSNINCKIISLDIHFRRREFKQMVAQKAEEEMASDQNLKEFTQTPALPLPVRMWHKLKGVKIEAPVKEAHRYHDSRAVVALAQVLPFKNNSVDLVFDRFSISEHLGQHESYGGQEDKPDFEAYIQEALRVLKPGGHLKIHDGSGYGWVEIGQEDHPSWKEQVLIDLGLDYKIIWFNWDKDTNERKIPLGVDIVKH